MDPISVLHAASAAAAVSKGLWDVGDTLWTFIKNAKVIDATLEGLASEAKQLSSACELAREQLEEIAQIYGSQGSTSASSDRLWQGFRFAITDCEAIILRLKQTTSGLQKVNSNFAKQAWTQFKLNLKDYETVNIRERIRSHTSSLQVIMLAINIKVVHLAPQLGNQILMTKLDRLEQMTAELKNAMTTSMETTAEQTPSFSIEDTRHDIVEGAGEVIAAGSTLYEASVAEGSQYNPSNAQGPVTDWLSRLEALNDSLPPIVSASSEGRAGKHSEDSTAPGGSVADLREPKQDELHVSDEESDDEHEADFIESALTSGKDAFDRFDYYEADLIFKEVLEIFHELPIRKRNSLDIFAVRYYLAVCAFYIRDVETAETALVSVACQEAKDDEERLNICHAGHLLAEIYVRLGKLDRARQSCDNSLQARRRLKGKQDTTYHESLALMGRILQLQGKEARSRIYWNMIPQSERADYDAVNKLKVESLPAEPKGILGSVASIPQLSSVDVGSTTHVYTSIRSSTIPPGPDDLSRRLHKMASLQLTPLDDLQRLLTNEDVDAAKGRTSVGHTTERIGLTALHLAVLFNDYEIAEDLLRVGASAEARCQVPFVYAIKTNVDASKPLDGLTPMQFAAGCHHTEMLTLLSAHGASLYGPTGNSCDLPDYIVSHYWSSLLLRGVATARETLMTLQSLGWSVNCSVSHTLDINLLARIICLDHGSMDPIIRKDVVSYLVEAGANLFGTYFFPLRYAILQSDVDLVKILLSRDGAAQIRYKQSSNGYPLHVAIGTRNPEVIQCLLTIDCDHQLAAVDDDGQTALTMLLREAWHKRKDGGFMYHNLKILIVLLTAGAQVDCKYENTQETVYEWAAKRAREDRRFFRYARLVADYSARDQKNVSSEHRVRTVGRPQSALQRIESKGKKFSPNLLLGLFPRRGRMYESDAR